MNVQSIDLSDELRQGVELCLDFAPVVLSRPIASQSLSRRELHALGSIRDRFPFRPLGCIDAPAQFGELRFRKVNFWKWTNCTVVSCYRAAFLYSNSFSHRFLLCVDVGSCKLICRLLRG